MDVLKYICWPAAAKVVPDRNDNRAKFNQPINSPIHWRVQFDGRWQLVSATQTTTTRPQGHGPSRVKKIQPYCKLPHTFLIMATTPEAWAKRMTASPFKLTSLASNAQW